jgi:hypothetical protein
VHDPVADLKMIHIVSQAFLQSLFRKAR